MAHNSTLVQSGTSFYVLAEDGVSTTLSLPSTTTVSTTKPPRFDVNGVHAVVVNSVTQGLIVDDAGIVLFFSPNAPTAAPTLAASAGAGALTGTFGVKYTFAIRDLDNNIVAESGFSTAASVSITSKKIAVSSIQTLSGLTAANYSARYQVVRRFYRTVAGGSAYFLWYTIADNTTTSFEDDTSDASISATAAASLGTAPFLSHIGFFKERAFGVDNATNREVLRYSESGLRWAWPSANIFTMPQVKGDTQSGITSIMPRRDALGIAKSSMLLQLTGTDEDDFRLVVLSTSVGCVSQESAAVYNDKWYFLGQDGVYRWGEDGLHCISDANERRGGVRSWFTTDDYFDRDEFEDAFGVIDVINKSYLLFLTGAGDTTVTRWVEYDITSDTWWGPHDTDAYAFRSAFRLGSHSPLIGIGTSDGYVTVDTNTRSDEGTVAITTEGVLAPIKASDPPTTAYFGTLTVDVEPQDEGSLYVYPTVGELADSEEVALTLDLADASSGLGRLGYGRFLKLRFYHNIINQIVQLLGFEVDPVNVVGRRE